MSDDDDRWSLGLMLFVIMGVPLALACAALAFLS